MLKVIRHKAIADRAIVFAGWRQCPPSHLTNGTSIGSSDFAALGSQMRRHETTERTCDLCSNRPHLCYASCMQRRLNKPLRAVPAGLILIHRFPLALLSFHNHRSLPVSIHGYHLQTLLTLPWLLFSPPSSLFPPSPLPPPFLFLPPLSPL